MSDTGFHAGRLKLFQKRSRGPAPWLRAAMVPAGLPAGPGIGRARWPSDSSFSTSDGGITLEKGQRFRPCCLPAAVPEPDFRQKRVHIQVLILRVDFSGAT